MGIWWNLLNLEVEMPGNFGNLPVDRTLNLFSFFIDGFQAGLSLGSNEKLTISWSTHINTFFNHLADFTDNLNILFNGLIDFNDDAVCYILRLQVFD